MTQAMIKTAHRPSWIDLSSNDASGSRAFYSRLFDWKVDVNPDPQYGGSGRATVHGTAAAAVTPPPHDGACARPTVQGRDAAGITPTQSKDQPTAWNFYIHTDDADETARAVEAAGGKVAMKPFDVGDQGRMAVFEDPAGAFISVWQPTKMGGFQAEGSNTFGW